MLAYIRRDTIVIWDMYVPKKFYALYRNGYLFGGAYYALYYKNGPCKFFDGVYEYSKPLPMLGVIEDTDRTLVSFIFYDRYVMPEVMFDIPVRSPQFWVLEPTGEIEEYAIYYDPDVCNQYNLAFGTKYTCPNDNPFIVKAMPFLVVEKGVT
jgi:hypothetical protein